MIVNRTALVVAVLIACGVLYSAKRRRFLGTRMNLLSTFLLDPAKLFPVEPYPRSDPEKAKRMVETTRKGWEDTAATVGKLLRVPGVDKVQDISIPSREPGRNVPARVYIPEGLGREKAPVLMYMHGGGWTVGSVNVYDGFCRAISSKSKYIVVSIEYRLAPEHPFPAGLEDCEDALRYIAGQPNVLTAAGGNCKQLVLGGDSAGGNLAAVLAVRYAELVSLQVLIYPAMCAFGIPLYRPPPYVACSNDSIVRNSDAPVLPMKSLVFLWESYLVGLKRDVSASSISELVTHPSVSPVCFSRHDLTRAPPAYVITAEADVLADEGQAYANKLRDAGVRQVEHKHYLGTVHGFMALPFTVAREEAIADLAAFLQKYVA